MKRTYPTLKETDIITCRNPLCGYSDEAWYFGIARKQKSSAYMHIFYHQTCPLCRDTRGDAKKAEDRTLAKARDILRHKAIKFKTTQATLVEIFNWPTVEELARKIKEAYDSDCIYCRNPYDEMGHGLRDISIDQIDPTIPDPYWNNFTLCCLTCNQRKSQMPPDKWSTWLAKARRNAIWKANRAREAQRPKLIPDAPFEEKVSNPLQPTLF